MHSLSFHNNNTSTLPSNNTKTITMLLQAAARTAPAAPAWLHRLARTAPTSCAHYSTQYEESVHTPNPSRSQAVESPPITLDSSTSSGDHVSDGRSSQTTSAYVAEEPLRQLVHKVWLPWQSCSLC